MATLSLTDEAGPFGVTLLEAAESRRTVLFSVGAGGNPERHLPLLRSLQENGFTVVAPHFERLVAPEITENDFLLRARRLRLALDRVTPQEAGAVGVGHSIGATLLLAMAGGQAWTRQGHRLSVDRDERLRKLTLLAPATGFFQAPAALDGVRIPVLAWAGSKDTVTPPAQVEFLRRALAERVPMEVHVEEGAGHFSFMNVPPPNVIEPLADRAEFLTRLTAGVLRFARD
ncbi:MAG: hypothetical protein K2X03_21530 [Bryobacteraceae bacterium]|nr:hypothetical protein [Bryobacteraceae bacterium]